MAKGGNWPPEYAEACLEKAKNLIHQSVYVKTSQTTKNWDSTDWLCDIKDENLVNKIQSLAQEIEPHKSMSENDSIDKYILTSCTSGKTYYANVSPIAEYFAKEDDFLDFCQSFEKGFVSSWSAKTARNAKLPPGIKRIRISGLGTQTKRNGFRLVAAEFQTEDTSEAFKFFHVLQVDEKQDREDYLTDNEIKSIISKRVELEEKYPAGAVSWVAIHD